MIQATRGSSIRCENFAAPWVWHEAPTTPSREKRRSDPRAKEPTCVWARKAREIFEASGRTYGSPRLTVALRRAGESCGRHRVARLMRKAGLRARQKRRFRPRTTDSRHLCPIAPNHLAERAEPPARPGEVWQADITYVATKRGLALRGRRARCLLAARLSAGPPMKRCPPRVSRPCLRACHPGAQRPAPGLLHHSDRGSQYASDAYRELLRSPWCGPEHEPGGPTATTTPGWRASGRR